jgi:CBS domain-containing protein
MSQELTLLPQDMRLPTAAHLLSRAGVSGAPVVDEEGRCVGVISTTDFVHFVGSEGMHSPGHAVSGAERVCEWQVLNGAGKSSEEVRDYMTPDPVTAGPDTSVANLARMMLDAHIHRVVVVDVDGRPTGVVSSTDILALMAQIETE